MAMLEIIFTNEEIGKYISYAMICQTRYSSIWNTRKRKTLWNKEFSDTDKLKAEEIFNQAYRWFVGKNDIPNTVRMDISTYKLWNRIEKFCYLLYM